MKPYDRLFARMKGKPVDKIPNLSIVMGLVAKEAGVTYSEYASDYRHLVEGNLRCAEKYGLDAYSVISDPAREASALGATISYRDDGPPTVSYSPVYEGYDISKMSFPDPLDSPRTLDRIRGVEELKRRAAGDYAVIGWVEGVLAETADMRGVNKLMMDLIEAPGGMAETMDRIFDYQCLFAKRQIEAGADIIGVGNAVASLIGPALYQECAMDYDKRLVDYIHSFGVGVKLHICGNITPLLPYLKTVAPDILDLDWMVDFAGAADFFKDSETSIDGNVDPVAVMLQGDIETVEREVGKCIDALTPKDMIAAGCEIPAATPPENLAAMNRLLLLH